MRESQQTSPPSYISLKRIMQQSYTLEDGTHLPRGTYVCIPTYPIENNPTITDNPEAFDGLRSYKKRQDDHEVQHQFTSTEPSVLSFGHGKTACPGRFFAVLALKAVFVKLLTEYEFKHIPGNLQRPENIHAHEFLFPNRKNTILVRRRIGAKAPF